MLKPTEIHGLTNWELLILSLAVQLEIKHRLAISHPLTGKTDASVQAASQHAQNPADAPATSDDRTS